MTINEGGGVFVGRVSSSRPRCERGRTVVLFKVRIEKGVPRRVESTTTNRSGRWRIARPDPQGRYYVVVEAKSGGRYGHRHRCDGARSGVKRVR